MAIVSLKHVTLACFTGTTSLVPIFNSLAPGRFKWNFKNNLIFSDSWLRYLLWNCPQMNIAGPYWWLRRITQHCFSKWPGSHQATSHYLNQWWLRSLQLIWRSGTGRFHLRVPDLQISCRDFTTRQGTSVSCPQQWLPGDMPYLLCTWCRRPN